MLQLREYGHAGPHVIVLHGGPGASGHMAPVAAELAGSYRVVEPFQRGRGAERLTVARHVADLHELISVCSGRCPPVLLGASWGAMLALAYAATHPHGAGPLILVGCGTFDLVARTELQKTISERMTDEIRARLKCADQLDEDERLRASVEAMMPIYSCDLLASPHEDDKIDARAHHETWDDMLRLQAEGIYPAAFGAIKGPILMVHGTFDSLPGRLISEGLRQYLPQLEYRELARCGHYPWLERVAADKFFFLVREWLAGAESTPQRLTVRPSPRWCMIAPMGVMYDYFAAPSDDAATAMLDHGPGGPGPQPAPPALAEAHRTGDREALREARREFHRLKVRESASGTLVLKTGGIDPLAHAGALEQMLTGTSYDEIAGRPRYGEPLAIDDWGSPLILRLPDELQTALINATDDQLNALIVPLSQDEGFRSFDVDVVTEFVRELAVLARTARDRGEQLYCWVCT